MLSEGVDLVVSVENSCYRCCETKETLIDKMLPYCKKCSKLKLRMLPPYLSHASRKRHFCPASESALHNSFALVLRAKDVLGEAAAEHDVVELLAVYVVGRE